MDAVKFIKERKRMCNGRLCADCPLFAVHQMACLSDCKEWCMDHPEASVTVVEKWAEEHPRKTRQSEFLRMWPNAVTPKGVLVINPCHIDCECDKTYCDAGRCRDCRREFWGQEVE